MQTLARQFFDCFFMDVTRRLGKGFSGAETACIAVPMPAICWVVYRSQTKFVHCRDRGTKVAVSYAWRSHPRTPREKPPAYLSGKSPSNLVFTNSPAFLGS
jgi:hypothetical protein